MTPAEKLKLIQAMINRLYEFNYTEPDTIIAALNMIDLLINYEPKEGE